MNEEELTDIFKIAYGLNIFCLNETIKEINIKIDRYGNGLIENINIKKIF